jgi:hypothetical protein
MDDFHANRQNMYVPGLKQNTSRPCVVLIGDPYAEENTCAIINPKSDIKDTEFMYNTITLRMFTTQPFKIRCNPRFPYTLIN